MQTYQVMWQFITDLHIATVAIAQNFGGGNFGEFGETSVIRQYFTQPNSRFTKVANVSYCKFANIFPNQNYEIIDSPKFYPTKILCYTVSDKAHEHTGVFKDNY